MSIGRSSPVSCVEKMTRHHDNRSQLSGSSVLVGERELATLNVVDGLLKKFSIVAVGFSVVVSLVHDDQVPVLAETVTDEVVYHDNDGAVDSSAVSSYAEGCLHLMTRISAVADSSRFAVSARGSTRLREIERSVFLSRLWQHFDGHRPLADFSWYGARVGVWEVAHEVTVLIEKCAHVVLHAVAVGANVAFATETVGLAQDVEVVRSRARNDRVTLVAVLRHTTDRVMVEWIPAHALEAVRACAHAVAKFLLTVFVDVGHEDTHGVA